MSRLLPKIIPLSLPDLGELSVQAFTMRTLLGPEYERVEDYYTSVIEPANMSFIEAVLALYSECQSDVCYLLDVACGKEAGWASALPPILLLPIAQALYAAHLPDKPLPEPSSSPASPGSVPSKDELVARLVIEAGIPYETVLAMTYAMVAAFHQALSASFSRRRAHFCFDAGAAAAAAHGGDLWKQHLGELAGLADSGAL